jgi:hypothetical protein
VLEQVATLSIGVGDHVLLVLDVGVRCLGAREVGVAHDRRDEPERGFVGGR